MRRKRIRRIKKPIYKKGVFWFLIFLPFVFGGLIWFFLFSDFFLIKKISVPEIEGKEEIKNLLLSNLKENFLKRENILFFNSQKIESKILNSFPQIKLVKISKKLPDEISIELTKRTPVFSFCNQNCYLVDDEGVAFKEKTNENLFEVKEEGKEVKIGEKVLSKEEIEKILKIKKEVENLGIFCEKVLISEEKVEFLTKDDWKLIFSFEKDVDFQLKKLKVAWEKLEEEKKKNLEYLDLRFENFVVPKYKTTQ